MEFQLVLFFLYVCLYIGFISVEGLFVDSFYFPPVDIHIKDYSRFKPTKQEAMDSENIDGITQPIS